MSRRIFRARLLFGFFLGASICLAFIASAPAQQGPLGNRDETEKPFLKNQEQFRKLLSGDVAPEAVKDKDLLRVAGRYYIWRCTWPTLQAERWDAGMGKVQADFEKIMSDPATASGKNKEFMKLLAHELVDSLKAVLKQPYEKSAAGVSVNTALTNAALMLPALAKCKQGEVADYLLELARPDAKGIHPFIRMCAIKGLGEFVSPTGPRVDSDNDAKAVADRHRRAQAAFDAMVQFIDAPYPPQGKGQEYDDAMIYSRREGVIALAKFQVPALELGKGIVKGPVAFELLKVASGGSVKVGPPISLSEKLEAAIGICQLKPGYNADLAAYVINGVLVEAAEAYRDDYGYIIGKDKEKDAPKRQPKLAWRIYATKLESGLKNVTANLPKGSQVKLEANAKKLLDDLSKHRQIEDQQLLQNALTVQPASTEVYPGNKEYLLPLTAK